MNVSENLKLSNHVFAENRKGRKKFEKTWRCPYTTSEEYCRKRTETNTHTDRSDDSDVHAHRCTGKTGCKPGDEVKVGQLIAEPGGFVSSPIYASVSGKVKKIDDILGSAGQFMQAVVIESDGQQTPYEGITPPVVTNLQEFLAAVRDSGVVGLGGAGFPTAVKLTVKDLSQIEYVIINGAECEPYITSDTRTMIDDQDLVWAGVQLLKQYLGDPKIVIGMKTTRNSASRFIGNSAKTDGVTVNALPAIYPQGGEKVLIYNVTGRAVPEGKLPLTWAPSLSTARHWRPSPDMSRRACRLWKNASRWTARRQRATERHRAHRNASWQSLRVLRRL
jgi:hypothetical protein